MKKEYIVYKLSECAKQHAGLIMSFSRNIM